MALIYSSCNECYRGKLGRQVFPPQMFRFYSLLFSPEKFQVFPVVWAASWSRCLLQWIHISIAKIIPLIFHQMTRTTSDYLNSLYTYKLKLIFEYFSWSICQQQPFTYIIPKTTFAYIYKYIYMYMCFKIQIVLLRMWIHRNFWIILWWECVIHKSIFTSEWI